MRGVWLVLAWLAAALLLGVAALPLLPLPAGAEALQAGWATLVGLGWGVAAVVGGLSWLFGVLYARAGGFAAALGRAAWLLAAVQWLWALDGLPAGLPQFGLGLGLAALGAWLGRPATPGAPPEQAGLSGAEANPAPQPLRFSARAASGQAQGGSLPVAQGQDWAEQVWWDEATDSAEARRAASD